MKAPGPIPALLKSAGTGPHDPIPTFKKRRSKAPGKKTPQLELKNPASDPLMRIEKVGVDIH